MRKPHPKGRASAEDFGREFKRVVAITKGANLKKNPRPLATKLLNEHFVWFKNFKRFGQGVFSQIISG